MRSYIIGIAVVLALLLAAIFATHTQAAVLPPKHITTKLAPPVPCTSKNRLDIFVDEDSIMWYCACEIYVKMVSCRWQVVGGVDSPEARKYIQTHKIRWVTFDWKGTLMHYYGPMAFGKVKYG